MSNEAPPTDCTPDQDRGVRVATLTGDRLCTKCNHNLAGQPILREQHYDMLIVRCPECAAVASIQEYPLLGRWASRWALVLATAWFAFNIGLLMITVSTIVSSSRYIVQNASYHLAVLINEDADSWRAGQAQPTNGRRKLPSIQPVNRRQVWHTLDPTYVGQMNVDLIIDGAGGKLAVIRPRLTEEFVYAAIACIILGCVWSVCLAHRRWSMLLLYAIVPMSLAILVDIGMSADRLNMYPGSNFVRPVGVARQALRPTVAAGAYMLIACLLMIGLAIGKPVTRSLMRGLLPHSMQQVFVRLWLVDGKQPPSNRLSRRRDRPR